MSSVPAEFQVQRRHMLGILTSLGVGTTVFRRALADEAAKASSISAETVANAEWVAGITLDEETRNSTASALNGVTRNLDILRAIPVGYEEIPALRFDPGFADPDAVKRSTAKPDYLSSLSVPQTEGSAARPALEQLPHRFAGMTIRELAAGLRDGRWTSVELTQATIEGLRKADPKLLAVVTITEDLALRQAAAADERLKAGNSTNLLTGIPWGAKDLIAVEGYPTTWGAPQFKDQVLNRTATVARRLEEQGAVLVAKLTLGALAMGDLWFGGMTRNPWNLEQGSSGSSAGSASTVSAGLLPFAIGSETLGSIVSPSRRCGISALRPTFGRVSRAGCMALSWTMDKLGPIARSMDDCGIVFNAIHGADPGDPTATNAWFEWPVQTDLSKLRIGHVQNRDLNDSDQKLLDILKELNAQIVPVELPSDINEWAVAMMLDVEAATAFHDITAAGNLDGLNAWPGIFRKSHFISAVDFLRASRIRSQLMRNMAGVFQKVDLYIGGGDLGITNLTGHPTVVVPVRYNPDAKHPQPQGGTLTGRLFDEATLLAVGTLVEKSAGLTGRLPAPFWG